MTCHCTCINQVSLLLHKTVWAAKKFGEQNWGSHFLWEVIWRAKIFGRKFWEEKCAANSFECKFWEQILLNENSGGKMGQNGEQILFEANFLARKFWGASFGGAVSCGEEISPAKIFGGFYKVKFHCEK